MKQWAVVFLALSFFLLPCGGFSLEVPRATGYVNDYANLLSPGVKSKLERFLGDFERTDSTQVVILTIPSLQGENLENFSIRVAAAWQPGRKDRENGVLILVAKQDRKMRIEVGKGLEGKLTDLLAGRIIDYEMAPRFGKGDFDGGILATVNSVVGVVRGEYQGDSLPLRKKSRGPWGALLFFLFLAPFMLRLNPSGSQRGRRRSGIYWTGGPFGGGGFGGGFGSGGFSGGGGGFGGGGASGSW
ncbi:MAG: TPM domain-containing protein [Deltaproteobacteria bacterium]|nr:TPM domain-containing protein [Deltaproteobacteria bacterium]